MEKKHGRKINYTIEREQVTLPIAEVLYSMQTYPGSEDIEILYFVHKNGLRDRFTLVSNYGLSQVVRFKCRNKFQTDVKIPPDTTVQEMKEIYIPKITSLIEYYRGLEQLEQL